MTEKATPELDQLNASVAGRYRIEGELGRGGMATVYLARDLRHDRPVALKVLRPELAAPRSSARFQREIRLTARLEHPGILPLFDSGEAAGQLWYAMPYVEGGTLRDRLRANGRLPVREAVALVQAVLPALGHAHRQGVIHRDLKPENILLSSSGPVIADFGIARALEGTGLVTTALTETGTALGTPEYMSPEQVAGRRVDGRSDLYAVATILYELLAGEPPYTGPSAQAVIAKRLTEQVPRVSILRPEVPPALERVVVKALAKSPADRYTTAAELGAALNAGLSGDSFREIAPHARLGRRLVWGGGVALAAGIAAGVFLRSAGGATSTAALDPQLVAVLPFTVTAPDSASNYLREGVVDLLSARLTGEGVPRAVDSRTLLARWRRVGGGRAITRDQALKLAQGFGAGQMVAGEVTRTPGGTTISGRVLQVPTGAVAAEHTESAAGELDELALIDRWVNRVFFVGAGEGSGRLANVSDSAEAVKAFLTGRAAHDRGEYEVAAAHYERALAIDSTFALAAYWLIQADVRRPRGPFPEHYRRAWLLRDRLSERDRAQLEAEETIGPRYPEPYTAADIIRAAERAAALNPDRPEAWARLGDHLLTQGAHVRVPNWLQRSAAALDSAIALDSTDTRPLWSRFYAALLEGNAESIRRYATRYLRAGPRGDRAFVTRWMAAHALGDSAALDSAIVESARSPISRLFEVAGLAPIVGLPLDPLARALSAYPSGEGAREAACTRVVLLQVVAAMRGQVARSLAYADSSNRMADCGSRQRTMHLAQHDSGYGTAPDRMAREELALSTAARPRGGITFTYSDDVVVLCGLEMWRLHRGDTSRVHHTLARLPRMVDSGMRHVFAPDLCIQVLAARLEELRGAAGPAPELERLDSLMREGAGGMLGGLADFLLARRFEARGDHARALAAMRRRAYTHSPNHTASYPAYLQGEGRLAALTGDTAGAIRAYQHYLVLRDRPDAGPMREEVDRVRAHLAELVGEAPGND